MKQLTNSVWRLLIIGLDFVIMIMDKIEGIGNRQKQWLYDEQKQWLYDE